MDYSVTELRRALLAAAEAHLGVSDEDGSEIIEQWFRDVGWGFWIEKHGYKNVEKYAWCGIFVGAMGLRVGDYLRQGMCVDVTLDPAIAKYVLPSTVRLSSTRKWRQAGYDLNEKGVYSYKPDIQNKIRRSSGIEGCVATVGDGRVGSHITIIKSVDIEAGTFTTVEGNATKDGFEGVVSKTRNIDEIKVLWMPRNFESLL